MNVVTAAAVGLLFLGALVALPLAAARDLSRRGHVLLPMLLVLFAGFVALAAVVDVMVIPLGVPGPAVQPVTVPPPGPVPPAGGRAGG